MQRGVAIYLEPRSRHSVVLGISTQRSRLQDASKILVVVQMLLFGNLLWFVGPVEMACQACQPCSHMFQFCHRAGATGSAGFGGGATGAFPVAGGFPGSAPAVGATPTGFGGTSSSAALSSIGGAAPTFSFGATSSTAPAFSFGGALLPFTPDHF